MAKQKYTVTLADTATKTEKGVSTVSGIIKVSADEDALDIAVEYAAERGLKDDAHYLVVGIERGDD